MNNLKTVIKNELIRYFISPLAYIYLISFLLLNGSFAIYFGHFFELGRANLLSMFVYHPWLYLLFLPGISMRLWAEEFRTKTIVQIMTMPVSTTCLVWGKFLASWIFCALALLLTIPFWICVNFLGNPDNGIIIVGYVGSFLLAGCMLAISQTMSALTKNQVIALVLAVIANLLFMFSGLEYVLSFFRLFAPISIVDMIASFSFITHFDTISRGLIELRDIIFFASIILLFNFTTIIIVSFRTAGTSKFLKSSTKGYYVSIFLLTLLGFIGLNLLANNIARSIQYDFTEEKIFSLTDTTKNILQNLPEPLTVKLYYSPELGIRNPQYRLMFDKVRLLLRQYSRLAKDNFSYAIYNPEPFSQYEDRAITQGLKAIPLIDNNQTAYFGITISNSIDQYSNIPFLSLERENLLEQDLTEAIYRLNHQKQEIGIISTLPVFGRVIGNVATSKWEIINQLEKLYNVKSIDNAEQISSKLKALIIIQPLDFDEDMLTAIKNYSRNGGKILLFADIAADSQRLSGPVTEGFKSADLKGLDHFWGFKFQSDTTIADLDNSLTIDAGNDSSLPNYTQDLLQFYINFDQINHQAPITKQLKKLLVSTTSIISPLNDNSTIFIPLLISSENSAAVSAKWAQDNISPGALLSKFKKDDFTKVIAAHIISKDPAAPFEVIAVADTDILYDNFWAITINLQDDNLIVPIFDNANFVLNALEALIGGDNLIELRGKSAKDRKFEIVEKLRRLARQEFKIKEQEIFERINKTKEGIQEIWSKKNFEERENFTPDELSIIAQIRKKLNTQRLELRDIRNNMNENIHQLNSKIKFSTIYSVPLLIILVLAVYFLIHRKKNKNANTSSEFFTRQMLYMSLSAFLLLLAGTLSVHLVNKEEIGSYEDKPLFEKLPQQINDVQKIKIISHDNVLQFYKQDGLWKLQGEENLLVLQDRMKSFLSALIEARFYEKKSDKAEKLSHFGLQPVSVDGSPNIRIELKNAKGETIQNLEVGKYDIEIGRGTKAAYIKFDNQFQVWLAAIELVDLSTDKTEWTFSRLWDLRFGRFLIFNHTTNVDALVYLAKYMLNTTILSSTTELKDAKPLFNINLQVEGNEKIDLSFLQKDDKYFVTYNFLTTPKNVSLKEFAEVMQGKYYEISKQDMEKIRDAAKKEIPESRSN